MSTQTHSTHGAEIATIGLHRVVAANIRAEMARQGAKQDRLVAALNKSQQLISNRLAGKTPFTIIRLTQELMGHSSPATTAIYAAVDRDAAARAVAMIEEGFAA